MTDDPQKKKKPSSSKKAKSGKKSVTKVGDFELKKRLGKGGMGEVFLAHQVSLDRMVALKDAVERAVEERRLCRPLPA